jgi:hypothetical protein
MKPAILAIALSVMTLTAAASLSEPRITGIVPDRPMVDAKPVAVTVNGENFQSGLSVQITTPGGAVKSIGGGQVTGQRPATFQISFAFDAEGAYEFVVLNADGGKSPPFRVQASRAATRPMIEQITPAESAKSPEPQVVTISGRNFAPGVKVSITDPTGTVAAAEQLDKVDAQTIVLKRVFDQSGSYAFMVTNPSGESSNTLVVTVR